MPQWIDDITPKPYVPQWMDDPITPPKQPNYQPPPSSYQPPQPIDTKFMNPPMNAPKQAPEQSTLNWWMEQAARNIPPVVGGFVGGVLGLPEGGIGAIPGAMAGGAAGSAFGNLAGNWVSGKEFQPAEFAVDTALGAIPPIFGPPKVAGPGIKELTKYIAKTAGMGALEGGLVSAGSTPFQHAARTGSFDAPLEEYAQNVGTGAGMGAVLGGGLGYFHGRGEQTTANAPIPPAPPLNTIQLPQQPANPDIAPNLAPPSSQGPHLVTIKDYGQVPYWKERGYVLVSGLKSPDGYQQMARADVAPLYRDYKGSKIKPTELTNDEDVLNLMDQMRTEEAPPPPTSPYTRENIPGALGEGYLPGDTTEVKIPNDEVDGPFIANMRESGFQIADKNPTHTIFKPIDPNMHATEPPLSPGLDELFDTPPPGVEELMDKLRNSIGQNSAAQLPKDLRGATPRYQNYELEFNNDLDKAFYIVAQQKKSKRHDDYLQFIKDSLGLDEFSAEPIGRQVRAEIANQVKGKVPGKIKLTTIHTELPVYKKFIQDGEVESRQSGGGEQSPEMTQILGRIFQPNQPLKTGGMNEFELRKTVRDIITETDPQKAYQTTLDRHELTMLNQGKEGARVHADLADLADQKYHELRAQQGEPGQFGSESSMGRGGVAPFYPKANNELPQSGKDAYMLPTGQVVHIDANLHNGAVNAPIKMPNGETVRGYLISRGDATPPVNEAVIDPATGMPTRVTTIPREPQLYDHLDQLQKVLKKGESGNDADVEALMQLAENKIINETDPAIIADNARQLHDYARSGSANANEQELFEQLYDVARTKDNMLKDRFGFPRTDQDALKNRIISDVTGGPQIRPASFNPAIPEGGGLDVAGIRQRNVLGQNQAFPEGEPLFGSQKQGKVVEDIAIQAAKTPEELRPLLDKHMATMRSIIDRAKVMDAAGDTAGQIRLAPELVEAQRLAKMAEAKYVDMVNRRNASSAPPRDPYEGNPFDMYRLPDGKIIPVQASASKGAPTIQHYDYKTKEYFDIDYVGRLEKGKHKIGPDGFVVPDNVVNMRPGEIPSNNPNAPPPPREELTPFQRRRQRIINSFNEVLPEAKSWMKTRFIMPSGKKLTHTHEIHEQAAIEAGTTLQGALESGIIRVGERFSGIEIHAPITMAQAQVLADAPHYVGKGIYVDVSAAREARSVNGSKNYRQFGEESTAREIYDWVNKIAKRSENDIAHLESRTSRENAIDTWETMTRTPYADKGPMESVIYDRNEKLNRDEKLALSKNPLMLDIHERISSIIERISHLSEMGLTSWVRRSGTVVDPGVMGLFKQNPDFEDFSAILLNTLEHIKRGETPEIAAKNMMETLYHELGHIDTGGPVTKYDPREAMQDPRIGKGFQDYIRQLVMNGEADRYHDISWMNRVIDLQMKVGVAQNAQFEKQLAEALSGGQSGRYRPEVPELLRIYQEAAGRERPAPDILSAAGIEQAGTRSAAGRTVSSNAQSTGAGTPPYGPPGSSGGGNWFQRNLGWGQGATKGGSRTSKDEVNWVREAMAVPSSVTTTGDLSFPGRQGLTLIATKEFWQAAGKMFKGGLSQAGFDAMNAELAKQPIMARRLNTKTGKMDPGIGEELGLRIYKLASQAGPHAEGIASRWLERGIGKTTKDALGNKTWSPTTGSKMWENTFGIPVKAANRAFLTMLNHLSVNRAQFLMDKARDMSLQGLQSAHSSPTGMGSVRPGLFSRSVDKNQAMDLNPYYNKVLGKEIIDFVNTATGHGPLRTHLLPAKQTEINLEGASKVLSATLFSPGLLARTVRFMNPSTYIMASPFVRKQYLKSALSATAAWYAFTEMAKMAGGDEVQVSNDPTSADFGKVRIGDTRLDPGGGFLQFAVAYSRMYQGGSTSSSTGQFHKFGAGYQAQTSEDMMERFMVNKLNPVMKFAYDVASASEYNPFHVADRTIQMFVPLIGQDLLEIYKEDPKLLPAMGTAAMFGMGTQIYSKGESVGKIIPPENDWLVKGQAGKDFMPWNWGSDNQ